MSLHTVRFRSKPLLVMFSVMSLALVLSVILSSSGAQAGLSARIVAAPGASTQSAQSAGTQREQPFDCARIQQLGIDKQMNFHASEILAACTGTKFQLPKDA